MALRLTGKTSNWFGEVIYIEIYDDDLGTPAADEINIVSAILTREGADNGPFSRIFTASLKVSFRIKDTATESFLADLADQNDKRFFVKVKKNYIEGVPPTPIDTWDDTFNGVLLNDEIRVENLYNPLIELTFVDGLSLIANNDYRPSEVSTYLPTTYATVVEHLLNIINLTPAIDYQDNPVLSTNINYYEVFHGSTSLDPLDKTRIKHAAFTLYDTTQNNFTYTKIRDVLNYILVIFDARLYYDTTEAIYRIVNRHQLSSATLNNYTYTKLGSQNTESNVVNTYTKTANDNILLGSSFSYLPPLKKAVVNYTYEDKTGLFLPSWNKNTASSLTEVGLIKIVSADTKFVFKGTLHYKTQASGAWIDHRMLFGLTVKFERQSDGQVYYWEDLITLIAGGWVSINPPGQFITSYTDWDDEVQIYTDKIVEGNNGYWLSKDIQIETKELASASGGSSPFAVDDYLIVSLEFDDDTTYTYDHYYFPDGNTTPTGITHDWYISNPEAYTTEVPADNDVNVIKESYYGVVSEDNTLVVEQNTILGDSDGLNTIQRLEVTDGADWIGSSDWAIGNILGGNKIQELVVLDMIRSQGKTIRMFDGTISKGNMRLGLGFVYDSETWIPLDGSENLRTGDVTCRYYAYKDFVISSTTGIEEEAESQGSSGNTSGGSSSSSQVSNAISFYPYRFTGSGTTQAVSNLPDPASYSDGDMIAYIIVFVGSAFMQYESSLTTPWGYRIINSATQIEFARDVTGETIQILIREFS